MDELQPSLHDAVHQVLDQRSRCNMLGEAILLFFIVMLCS